MNEILFSIKNVELLVIEVFVFGAVAAVLAGGVYEIVRAKVREARRRDQIAERPVMTEGVARRPARP